MKQRHRGGFVFVGVLMLIAACANGGDATTDGGGGDGSKPKVDGSNPQDTGANTCVSSCTGDTDCQNSCTVPAMAIACCDLTTNTCYTTNNNVCASAPDGGQTD